MGGISSILVFYICIAKDAPYGVPLVVYRGMPTSQGQINDVCGCWFCSYVQSACSQGGSLFVPNYSFMES